MTHRTYISNISPSWSIADQEKLLAERVPNWPDAVYRDELKPRQLRARDTEKLEQRAELLRLTGRKARTTTHVATLAVMDWRQPSFRKLLEGLAARGDRLFAHQENRLFDLTYTGDIEAAVAQFPISRTESGRRAGRLVGAAASAATRNAISKAAAEKIKDRWGAEGHTATALVAESGFTYHTMKRWLGRWEDAAKRRKRNAKRAAKLQEQRA
jgi:DNA invertase Pin-like site-specific DNA recombinase